MLRPRSPPYRQIWRLPAALPRIAQRSPDNEAYFAKPSRAGAASALELLVVLEPPVGHVDLAREPDVTLLERVLDELAERRRPPRLAGPARMEADRHQLR